jgi:exodeoxyribonuclease V alpha subunit
MEKSQTLTGHIESVIFSKPDTGFAICSFTVEETAQKVTVVGVLPGATPGQLLRVEGKWETRKNYGRQFRFTEAQAIRPSTTLAILRYLGSGLIPGIGKTMAKRIVDQFGKSTLDILDTEIDMLLQVSGIGPKSLKKVKKAWTDHRSTRELAIFCQEMGLSTSFAPKLAKQYGANAEMIVRNNPFRLALDIKGIGFPTADRAAGQLGVAPEHQGRALAGLVHVLEQAGADGNVALPEQVLVERGAILLDRDVQDLEAALAIAMDEGHLAADSDIAQDRMIYTRKALSIEIRLANAICGSMESKGSIREFDPEKALEWAEKKLGMKLADLQKKAITEAVSQKIMVITGGPGTGKTTIIRAVLEIFSALKQDVALAAPTGRAAKRMSETTGRDATTIHRLLNFNPHKRAFTYGPDNPVEADVVIVDESSMLDQWLAEKLISAIRHDARLILVGDVDQLPSVGPGNVLSDILESKQVPFVRLDEIFRQDAAGLIVKNAHRIHAGKKPILPAGKETSDFYFLIEDDPVALRDLICDLVASRLPSKFGFDPMTEIQVITPMHRGEVGVQSLNVELQRSLNPNGQSLQRYSVLYRVGDKVMQTVNDYDMGVYNGDIGRITSIKDGEMMVRFEDGPRQYTNDKVDNLILAYALSVHKSQGSEYPAVVLPMSTQHFILLQRNLLYTAITRAQKLVVLAGSQKALFQAINNDRPAHRYTGLTQRLKQHGKGRLC